MSRPRLKRLLRINLRTTLVVVALLCVIVGWKVRQVERQKDAVAVVEASAGWVKYNHEIDENYRGRCPGPDWLCELIGVDYFATVVRVGFQKHHDIAPLASLKNLDLLLLIDAEQSDLQVLAHLTTLRYLVLGGEGFTDLSPLANLNQLKELQLIDTEISDEEIKDWRA